MTENALDLDSFEDVTRFFDFVECALDPRGASDVIRRLIARVRELEAALARRCACALFDCPNAATTSEYSPFMDAYCDDCAAHRCDVDGHQAQRIPVPETKEDDDA